MSECFRCCASKRTRSNSETAISDLDGRSSGVVYEQNDESNNDRSEAEACANNITRSLRASICLKLTIFVGLLVMLASGAPALVLWFKAHDQLVGEIEHRLLIVSTLRQEQLKDYLISERDKTKLIATRVLINDFLTNKTLTNRSLATLDLRSAVNVTPDFTSAAIYDSHGQLSFATNESLFAKTIPLTELDSINGKELKLGLPIRTPVGWAFNMSRAIVLNQMLIGVLMTWVNGTKLEGLVHDRTGLQQTGELLIGVPEGPNLVHLLFPPIQNPDLLVIPRSEAMSRAINGESGVLTVKDYHGVKVIAAYRPVGFMNWGLLAKIEVYEAYAPIRSFRIVIIIAIVVLLLLGVMASLGLAKVFTSPIIELGRAAAALGQGDMRTRVKKGTIVLRDEIADLKDAFNSMAHQIASHQLILEHEVRERTADLARANEGLANEIDERRKIEMELETAKDVAIAANRSKSEFLANMSHEIRTPLNAIINFTELCLDTQITPEQQEHLDYVRFAAQHLLRIITDILDFSKIEAGKLEMEEIQFSLFDQLEHAVSVLAARAQKNGLELCCRFDVNVPDQIIGDPGRLLQIFVNLIGNGIKFTKKGEVVVSVSVQSKTSDDVELLFAVKDTGLGIPENKQPLLFQAFSQVDSSTQRLYGGTGLGLVISSKIAAAMGGRMWVESDGTEDHGSIFWFTGNFHVPPACNVSFTSRVDMFKGVPALIVDDNETSRGILVDLLRSWGMIADGVSSVESAESALQKAADAGQKYIVILLDMWLNGTDASELVYLLRERPNLLGRFSALATSPSQGVLPAETEVAQSPDTGNKECAEDGVDPEVPAFTKEEHHKIDHLAPYLSCQHSAQSVSSSIVMLTSVNHSDATRCIELGTSIHTSKPIKRSLLVRVLQLALGTQDNSAVSEGQASKGVLEDPIKSLHILVAEDNVVNQRVALMLLKKWGHRAVLARNGAEAVEQFTKAEFDLVLMDVQMPICDGFEATAKIRDLEKEHDKGGSTPIVAMTAHAMSGDGDRCIAAGMDFYISKPLNAKKLQEVLQNVAKGSLKGHSVHSSSRPSSSL